MSNKISQTNLISIIIPVYNVAKYLAEALDSVLCQTYSNLEIIIVDDGSTDGSGEICERYKQMDERIYLVHQKNKGLSAARNVGLNTMTGYAVTFLDSDDVYYPEYIAEMVDAMLREKAELVMCKFSVHNSTIIKTEEDSNFNNPPIPQGAYDRVTALRSLVEGSINHAVWNKMFRKELWDDVRFPEGHVFEDIDTTYKIIDLCNTVYVLDSILYCRRRHEGSIVYTYSEKNVDDYILASYHFETFVKNNIPTVFSEEQLIYSRRIVLNKLIDFFLLMPDKNGENEKYKLYIRNKIIEIGKDVGIGTSWFRRKVSYKMICICPRLIRFVYPLYCTIQQHMMRCMI